MELFNLFGKKPNADEVIKKLNVIAISENSPFQNRFFSELSSKVLYELYMFHYFYAWLYNIDNELIDLTDLNILKYHLFANRLLNDVCHKSFSDNEFHAMFKERFANYRKELSLVKKGQFNDQYFPAYFYSRIIKFPLSTEEIDTNGKYNHRDCSKHQFADCYVDQVNYLQNELDSAFK